MSNETPTHDAWSQDGFQEFWNDPKAGFAKSKLHEDVVGRWPGGIVIKGRDAYLKQLGAMLALTPDLRLEILDHARNGNVAFMRWRSHGTGPLGPFEMEGMDMVRLEGNKEIEIVAFFDPGVYRKLIGSPVPGAQW